MKRKSTLIVFSTLLLFGSFSQNLYAADQPIVQEQPRIIEEEIVLSDPTVAQPKKWLVGGSGELWYVWKNWIRWDDDKAYNSDVINSGKINGGMTGGTVYAGYDNLTVSYSYRKGSWDGSSDTSNVPNATATLSQEQTEHEITGRWLFKGSKHYNPYVLAGYNHLTRTETMSVDAAHPFTYVTPTVTVCNTERTYKSPLVGIGAIVPINKSIGVRGDLRLMYSWADWKRDDGKSLSKTDVGGAVVGTGYWNIWKGLNAQLGWKYQRLGLHEGGELGATSKTGIFGMMGYTFKL